MKVYVAGPLFASFEREYLERISKVCESLGFDTFLPHRDAGILLEREFSEAEEHETFLEDRNSIPSSDILVALISGADTDSGTAWEMGYASALGKKVIGFVDDNRAKVFLNPMIGCSCMLVHSFEELEQELKKLL